MTLSWWTYAGAVFGFGLIATGYGLAGWAVIILTAIMTFGHAIETKLDAIDRKLDEK